MSRQSLGGPWSKRQYSWIPNFSLQSIQPGAQGNEIQRLFSPLQCQAKEGVLLGIYLLFRQGNPPL